MPFAEHFWLFIKLIGDWIFLVDSVLLLLLLLRSSETFSQKTNILYVSDAHWTRRSLEIVIQTAASRRFFIHHKVLTVWQFAKDPSNDNIFRRDPN